MQTILGSGGAVGIELAKALTKFTKDIRLVSRNPKKVNDTDQLLSADLLDPGQVKKAVRGSNIVYVTIGFQYSLKVWQQTWPNFMKNVIDACAEEKCKLVFFDNIYMYDANALNGMTEEAPVNPPSKKGEVRREIAQMVLDAVAEGKLKALIARSADFYGPSIKDNSMLSETVFNNLKNGKKANWMMSVKHKHSFTYTPDAGKATAILGNTDDAYNQVWHLPTAANPLTGKQWIEEIAKAMGKEPKTQVVPKFLVKIIGWFIPIMKEMVEMLYQYDRDYVFDSTKFENKFGLKPTPYLEGIKEIVVVDYK